MSRILALLFCMLLQTQGFITFDSGNIKLNYGVDHSFNCQNGNVYTYQFTFSGEFENTPQVFLSREKYDQDIASLQMYFSITSITKTCKEYQKTLGFNIRIECISKWVYVFNLRWFAIDDYRVEIINCFDWTTFGQQTISHANPNALKGFPAVINYSYSGAFSFDITIDQITSTSVTFTITQNGQLVNLGFLILLIIEEGFSFVDRQQLSADYTSSAITIKNGYSLIVVYVGFNDIINTSWIREYTEFTLSDTTIVYKMLHNGQKTQNTHYATWIATVFTKEFKAMEVSRINTAQYYDSDENRPFNQVKILELNLQYNSFSSNQIVIDKSVNILNIEIINVCNPGKKYITNFNVCNSCTASNSKKIITKTCSTAQNTLAFRFRVLTSFVDYKVFQIVLSNTGIAIKQILYNQKKVEVNLIEILESIQ